MEGKREGRAPHGWFCKGAEGLISVPHGGEGSTFGVLGREKTTVIPLSQSFQTLGPAEPFSFRLAFGATPKGAF